MAALDPDLDEIKICQLINEFVDDFQEDVDGSSLLIETSHKRAADGASQWRGNHVVGLEPL